VRLETSMITRRVPFIAALAVLPFAQSHAATGIFKSERTNGPTKTCSYVVLGSPYTVDLRAAEICPLTIEVPNPAPSPPPGNRQGPIGVLTREQPSGSSKICYYSVLGSTKTLTVSSVALCPASYRFE
jgi:hypothetical protein